MSDVNSTNSRKSPNEIGGFPNIINFAAEHDRLCGEIAGLPQSEAGDEEHARRYARQWEIRALIAATPSKSQSDLHAKTRIFQVEAARDSEFECDCSGSARDLAKSIAADVMAMQVAA
jgi:hypothetical protein